MPDPTMDEMLAWLGNESVDSPYDDSCIDAIRAILEKLRDLEKLRRRAIPLTKRIELDAIRAFVQRVEERLPHFSSGRTADARLRAYQSAVHDELASMEKEARINKIIDAAEEETG